MRERIGWLDFLRLLAVVLVLARHTFDSVFVPHYGSPDSLPLWLAAPVGFGWSGVSLFFIISGYIVGGPLLEKIAAGTFSYSRFIADRAFRILPAAVAVLLFTHYMIGWHPEITRYSYGQALFFQNYAQPFRVMPWTDQFWSLGVEQHFYILAPLVLALLVWLRRMPGALTLAALLVLYAILRLAVPGPFSVYTASHWQLDYFVVGMCFYFGKGRAGAVAITLALVGYLLASIAIAELNGSALLNQRADTIGVGMLAALAVSAGIFYVIAHSGERVKAALSWSVFRAGGILSYSIYLVHVGVIRNMGDWFGLLKRLDLAPVAFYFAALGGVFVASVLVAAVLYLTVERSGLRAREFYRGSLMAPGWRERVAEALDLCPRHWWKAHPWAYRSDVERHCPSCKATQYLRPNAFGGLGWTQDRDRFRHPSFG